VCFYLFKPIKKKKTLTMKLNVKKNKQKDSPAHYEAIRIVSRGPNVSAFTDD